MSSFDPKSETPKSSTGGKPRRLVCSEWEALLVDALDGTLSATESAAFEAHRETCLACAQLLEEAKRGSEWLHFLEAEPDVPQDLVGRILAQTSGTELTPQSPLAVAGEATAAIVPPGWLPGLERHAAQSRWMMTAAMAFFSIAFTLNLTGVRLNGFHLSDLKPTAIASSLTRQFYVADAHLVRYYDNLRFVYELESRVREIKQNTATPLSSPQSAPADPAPANTDKNAQPKTKPGGGSAQKMDPNGQAAPAAPRRGAPVVAALPGEPIMASLRRDDYDGRQPHLQDVCLDGSRQLELKAVLVVEARTGRQAIGLCTKQRSRPVKNDITTGREGV